MKRMISDSPRLLHLPVHRKGGFSFSGKETASNARDLGLIPGLERYPGDGNGNPLQYSYLENPMDRGA